MSTIGLSMNVTAWATGTWSHGYDRNLQISKYIQMRAYVVHQRRVVLKESTDVLNQGVTKHNDQDIVTIHSKMVNQPQMSKWSAPGVE